MNGHRTGRGALLILLAVLAFVRVAEATTFTVTNANDSGSGSLRAAIDLANADGTATSGSPHSIAFSGTLGIIRLSSALPLIANHMTIDGGTLNAVIIDGLGTYRGFFIDTGTVTLRNLVIYNTKAKGGDGVAGGGGGAGLGGAVFVNQATAAVTLDTVAISTSNVTGGNGGGARIANAGGGGGGMAFDGAGPPTPFNLFEPRNTDPGGGGGGGGLFGAGTEGNATTSVGGTGGAGGGGGGGGLPHGGAAGSQVTTNAAAQRGLNRGEGVYTNGVPPAAGGAGGFGGGGGGGVVAGRAASGGGLSGAGEYNAGGGAGGFGGGGGGAPYNSGVNGGAGGFGGGGGGGIPGGGAGGTGGGRGGGPTGVATTTNGLTSNAGGGGGAAFGPAAFVNSGTLTIINSTALNLSATAGTAPDKVNGAQDGTADATAIYNRAGTVTGSFASGTPQSGYWWYAVEDGRGYALEIVGGRVFMTFYFYAADGTAKWWTSTATMLDTAHYWASTYEFRGGQQLNGAYQAPSPATQSSNVFIAFTGPTTAIMSWADGTIPLTRFDIVGGGVAAGPAAGSPEKGWYWNSGESGRGWFVEVQNSTLFLSGFMYDARGEPTWYTSQGAMTTTSLYSGTLMLFAGGKAIGGTNQAPTSSTSQGTVTLQFPTTTTAILTLPGGGTVNLVRYTF